MRSLDLTPCAPFLRRTHRCVVWNSISSAGAGTLAARAPPIKSNFDVQLGTERFPYSAQRRQTQNRPRGESDLRPVERTLEFLRPPFPDLEPERFQAWHLLVLRQSICARATLYVTHSIKGNMRVWALGMYFLTLTFYDLYSTRLVSSVERDTLYGRQLQVIMSLKSSQFHCRKNVKF